MAFLFDAAPHGDADPRVWIDWFRKLSKIVAKNTITVSTADPTTSDVPVNGWLVWNNTTLGETRVWANVAGTMKKSAAFV